MDKKVLRNALFGYSKLSVCEHIADITERFNSRILAIEENNKKEKDELKEKLVACEAELAEYKQLHTDISNALVDAQQYAASIKEKAEQDFERIVDENKKMKDILAQRLETYIISVKSVKNRIVQILNDTDDELSEIIEQAADIEKEFGEQK